MAVISEARAARDAQLNGPVSVVDTACPLDCPDSCSLSVTVQNGKVITIDGSHRNPVTDGFICAKVRKFDDRVYGPDRLLTSRRSQGTQRRRPLRARDLGRGARADRREDAGRQRPGGARESILPYSYGGSNGLLTQDNLDATLWRRFGTSRLARTVCAAPTGAANMGLYGKMPSVTYEDYPEARLIVLWGVNPNASGIHLIPFVREAQSRGAKLVVIDPRSTQLARAADVHLAGQARHRRRGRTGDSPVSLRERLRRRTVPSRTHAQRRQAARAGRASGRSSGPRRSPASTPRRSSASRGSTPRRRRPWSAAAGVSSAIATAAAPPLRSWRCRLSAGSSACAAAATR